MGGVAQGRSRNVKRNSEGEHKKPRRQYFSGNESLYDYDTVHGRFGCPRNVLGRLWRELDQRNPFVIEIR